MREKGTGMGKRRENEGINGGDREGEREREGNSIASF